MLGQNDLTQGQANRTGMPPDQKVNKAELLTYLSLPCPINILQSPYDDHHEWRLHYKCVIALALALALDLALTRIINYAPRVTLQMKESLIICL